MDVTLARMDLFWTQPRVCGSREGSALLKEARHAGETPPGKILEEFPRYALAYLASYLEGNFWATE